MSALALSAAAKPSAVQAISQKDKDQGAQAHPQLVAEFGGAVTGAQATAVALAGPEHRARAIAVVLSIWLATPRIAIASGSAFLVAQMIDVFVFDRLRRAVWWQGVCKQGLLNSRRLQIQCSMLRRSEC